MARLNEAPPPQETVDQLKRRFIRQNRELAKNNSAQSVRIRALENEQARILAENLALREQIIQLQTELEQTRGPNAVQQISSVKDQLESKLLEIGSLVAELGSINKPSHKAPQSDAGPSRAVEHFEWRRAMKEQAGEQDDDDVLPTIREDKYYPRRTLDAEELHAVLSTSTDDSPDLGPPPVAHFTDEDPIKFDPKPTDEDAQDGMELDQKDDEVLPATISINLETRRRRRDSSKLDLRKMSVFHSPEESKNEDSRQQEPSKMVRKRKLSATAEETNGETNDKDCRDDFRFSRRGVDRENRNPLESAAKQTSTLEMLLNTDRRALGDKTNTSPKKVQKSDSKSDAKKLDIPKEAARNRVRERRARAAMLNVAPPETTNVVDMAEIQIEEPQEQEHPELPPKTPAGLDLTSPTSTQPSGVRQESKDTPPPGDLGATNSETSAVGRPSRRARPQVNYAEPSLVSKMRRPSKNLVDAVVDNRRSSDEHSEQSQSTSSSTNPLRTVVIKRERQEDAGNTWKAHSASAEPAEPHSPLSSKTAAAQSASSESQTKEPEPRDRKHATDDKPTAASSGSTKDIALSRSHSAATSSSRKRTGSSSKNSSSSATDHVAKDRPDLAIFDFNTTDGSSPADDDKNGASREQDAEAIMRSSRALAAKSASFSSSRRHSSAMSAPSSSSSSSTKERGSGERVASSASSKSVTFSEDGGRAKAPRQSKSSSSSSSSAAAAEAKPERSSTRRKSMMV